jgi:hypothetical protein
MTLHFHAVSSARRFFLRESHSALHTGPKSPDFYMIIAEQRQSGNIPTHLLYFVKLQRLTPPYSTAILAQMLTLGV